MNNYIPQKTIFANSYPCPNLTWSTVYPKKYAHGFCFAVLCCGYTLTDFPISIRLTSLALWQSNDCPSASKATLMNMDKYFMWIHYELLHNHNKAKHNKTMCIFLGIYCMSLVSYTKEVNPRLNKCPLRPNGCLASLRLTSLLNEATGVLSSVYILPFMKCIHHRLTA